jgi:hypothetical protein
MKLCLWAVTILGLLPVTAFALIHIVLLGGVRRALPTEEPAPNSVSFPGGFTVQFGDSSKPMEVSTSVWPGIAVLVGASACLVGLYFLVPRQPERVALNGFANFEPCIRQVIESRRSFATVVISARDGNEAISIMSHEGDVEIGLSIDSTLTGREAAVRELIGELGVEPTEDNMTPADELNPETRHLMFPLRGNPSEMADTCVRVFSDILEIKDDEEMVFSFGCNLWIALSCAGQDGEQALPVRVQFVLFCLNPGGVK